MREIDIPEAKKMMLDILKTVAKFCDDNNLRYFIFYGTYLGALRHKGYIPWDDDIDIAMPRPDYEKFLEIFKGENLSVWTWRKDNNYLLPFAKVYDTRTEVHENADFGETFGVNIDIFPLDGLPAKQSQIKRRVEYMRFCWGMQVAATIVDYSKRSKKKRMQLGLMKAFYKVFPVQHYLTGRTEKHAKKYDFDTSEYVACLVWGDGMKEVFHRESLFPPRMVQFEDAEFKAPATDECLRVLFGDYMQLPPEDQRRCHAPKINWKE